MQRRAHHRRQRQLVAGRRRARRWPGRARRQRLEAQAVQAPTFEVDPMWPKPLPNHWVLGSTIGVGVDSQGPRVHHPPRRLDAEPAHRGRRGREPADRRVLRAGAADARVRSGGQPREGVGRPGRGLRLAELEPRHHDRRQGQRLDRRERHRRLAHPQVHARRQVPGADRRAGPARRTATTRRTSAASRRSRSTRRRTRRSSPTATATSASP